MKTYPLRLFVCLGFVGSVLPCAVLARGPKWTAPADAPAPEPSPLPAEPPPAVNPEAAPSLSLRPFLETHLDKILAPLGTAAFVQTDLIAGVRAGYEKTLAAAPDARKSSYRLALALCDVLTEAIGERQKAVTALNGAYEMRRSEAVQPRGGRQAVKDSDKDESFFYNGQKNNWLQNAASLRQRVATLLQRERAAETQAGGPWVSPTPTPLPVASSGPTPSVSVPPPEVDPVAGGWMWEGRSPIKLDADHSITGSRSGTWLYTCTTDAGRNYEMHWAHKDWVDYVVLSANGKILDGKSKQGKRVSANR